MDAKSCFAPHPALINEPREVPPVVNASLYQFAIHADAGRAFFVLLSDSVKFLP